ncbi:MAG TPA: hypothetical protein VFX67_07540 [Burkholderiales bacterium]|nr:hypothetical protein [Burkholderiales bacterium]
MAAAFDLARPPFRIIAGQDAQAVAQDFVRCYEQLASVPDKAQVCLAAALEVAGLSRDAPLARAGLQIARDMDAGVGAGRANAYHNTQHFCEVLLNALYLARLAASETQEMCEILLAALVHDFHHDGATNGGITFRLERLAADATMPYLEAARVADAGRLRVTSLIFATELMTGMRFARQCYLHLSAGAPRPSPEGIPEPLQRLASDAGLAREAVIVGEADLLSSVGLTVRYGELQQQRLAEEWQQPLGADHKLRFLDWFEEFTIGRFFSPNLRALKEAARSDAATRSGSPG